MIEFTGERIVPEADNCEPLFAEKMYQEHIVRYLFAAQVCKDKDVLDIGCGVGYGSNFLAKSGAKSVTAFDLSEDAINHAREFYNHPQVEFLVASAEEFAFKKKFDVAVCYELIEHVYKQDAVIDCIAKALKEDGLLLISTPRALAEKRTDFHTKEFNLDEYKQLLNNKFKYVEFYFENNHFTSLITNKAPTVIRNLHLMHEQFTLDQADYFIAVASQKPIDTTQFQEQLSINNDRYILNLEKDVQILQKAERDLKEQIKQSAADLRDFLSLPIDEQNKKLREELKLAEIKLDNYQKYIASVYEAKAWQVFIKFYKYIDKLNWIKNRIKLYIKTVGYKALARAVYNYIRNRYFRRKYTLPTIAVTNKPINSSVYDIIFLIGCWEGESKRYRVYNCIDVLSTQGYHVTSLSSSDTKTLIEKKLICKTLVFFRVAYDDFFEEVIKYAHKHQINVVYDIDDLVFEPESVKYIHAYEHLSPEQQVTYRRGVERYRRMLMACDYVTCSTSYLAQRAEKLGKSAFVIPNTVNTAQINHANLLLEKKRNSHVAASDKITIGYFSGSNTHQQDFKQAEPALLEIMKTYPQCEFVLVGLLDLNEQWAPFKFRIKRVPFQPYLEMLSVLADIDINIAPLELNNPFCEGKSQLKIFEAGLVEVPTIASATQSYKEAIEHNIDGLLAANNEDWKKAFELLINSPERRKEMGKKARERTLRQFTSHNLLESAIEHFQLSKDNQVLAQLKSLINFQNTARKLKIAWIIPELIIGGGGHRNILRAAFFLQLFGHDIELYFLSSTLSEAELSRSIVVHFYPLVCTVKCFTGEMVSNDYDVIFATHWSTVAPALQVRNTAKEIMYFVQDFEPYFYPMGSAAVLAEDTYRKGLYHICSGPWCEKILRRDYKADADHFIFPVDTKVYYPRKRTSEKLTILFFAKPEMPRRCYELGIMALEHVHKLMPEVEIVMFGSKNIDTGALAFPVTIKSVLPTINDLAELYSNADLGMVFSTTNPSLVPYEMMACGLPVVDLNRGDNEVNYDNRMDIALLADPNPEIMAQQIVALLQNPKECKQRSEAGKAFVATFPSEIDMVRRIEQLILQRLTYREHKAVKPATALTTAI